MEIIQEIIQTLSDAELIIISEEINNPDIPKEVIFNQIMSKSNKYQVSKSFINRLTKFWTYIYPSDPRGMKELPQYLALELSKRLRVSNSMRCQCLKRPKINNNLFFRSKKD